jgi:hypothetical protein
MVMLGDAVAAKKSSGEAKETLEVIDVAQLLVRSSAIPPAGAAGPTAPTGPPPGGGGRTG